MGVTISGKPDSRITAKSLDMGYMGFHRLRCLISEHLNKEFSDLYKTIIEHRSDEEWKKWDALMNDIIAHYKLGENKSDCLLLDFLFSSDCKGKISYGTCHKIYELIKGENDENKIGYVGRPDCATVGDFKKLLLDVFNQKGTLVWF